MTPQEEAQVMAQATRLNFQATPVQMGPEIRVLVQVGDIAGMTFTLALTQDGARAVSKLLKEGVEKAEVMIVKPPGLVASA